MMKPELLPNKIKKQYRTTEKSGKSHSFCARLLQKLFPSYHTIFAGANKPNKKSSVCLHNSSFLCGDYTIDVKQRYILYFEKPSKNPRRGTADSHQAYLPNNLMRPYTRQLSSKHGRAVGNLLSKEILRLSLLQQLNSQRSFQEKELN